VLQPAATRRRWPRSGAGAAGLADRAGTRIGHGKGHYDRALATCARRPAGHHDRLGWEMQIAETALEPIRGTSRSTPSPRRRNGFMQEVKPKWRNGAGMALILLLIAAWCVAVRAGAVVSQLPFVLEMLFYACRHRLDLSRPPAAHLDGN
jgi:hypothetical protein